ncbi:titin isoform X2 [Phlebotomus argentipes]|uniref:titin isoform X2 n=1 Tax=Phlebotomus argentipes TaxID=94469 RepID=UPI002892BAB8|nr:titin isoform X2 [Phlebotomus argentipes]
MVVDLKFSKFNDTPWGFRLTGGADFDFPLTVIKVTEGSLAAQAGMQLGDVVVRINDTPASSLSHLEAHNVLLAAGNNFMLGVIRENEQDAIAAPDESVTIGNPAAEVPALPANIQEQTIIEEPTQEAIEEKLMDVVVTDDQIAEVISSEAEVLKEHNVIGVNFNKIIPQALSLKTSEVFKTLNAQAVQTKEEKVQEERKWTTFLQKPNRPIPKSKWDIEQEKRESYKVKIVKQPKPRIAPDRVATPPPMMIQPDSPKEEPERVPETNESAEQPLPSQSDAPEEEEIDLQAEEVVELVASTADDEVPDLEEPQVQAEPENPDELPRELEEKLADVQRQLLSLSNLPHAIQATLDAVTEQLSKIVPATKEEIQEDPTECQEDVRQEITAEERGENEVSLEDQEVSEIHREIEEELVSPEPVERGQEISEIMNEDVQDMEQRFKTGKWEIRSFRFDVNFSDDEPFV